MNVRRVLMVACDWLPQGGSGVQRTAYFATALPRFGWRPTVLTETVSPSVDRDEDLARRTADVPCVRTRSLRPPSNLRHGGTGGGRGGPGRIALLVRRLITSSIVPDKRVAWLPVGTRAGLRLLGRDRFDAIYSTSPYPTAHLVARRLARRSDLPWVVDLRDPWWFFLEARPLWPFSVLNARLEGSVVRGAGAVLGVREGLLEDLRRRFPDLDAGRLHRVPNGYDPAMFEGVEPRRDARFGIVYAGLLHGARHPKPLFRAVRQALDRRPDLADRLVIRIFGTISPDLDAWCAETGLPAGIVESLGFVPRREAAAWMRGADLLYLNSVDDYVPGKVYEYLGSGRGVLALLDPATEVGRLLEHRNAAVVVRPEETERASEILLERIDAFAARGGPEADRPPATDLSREAGAESLSSILDGLAPTSA